MWRAWLLFLCLAAGSRQLSIKEFSVPAALEAGKDAQLKCQYDLSENESDKALFVKWWWTPVNGSSDERIQLYQRIVGYNAEAIHDNIEVENNDGIKLLNVSPSDSGIYECEVSNIDEVRQHQKLIVFSMGSGPLLNVSQAEDAPDSEVVATCEAYDVAPSPSIAITLNGRILKSSGYVTESIDDRYDIYENATIDVTEADGGDFRCEMFFKDDDVTHAPFVASQTFDAPTASTTEAAADATLAPEPPSDTAPVSQPSDCASDNVGALWMLLATTLSLLYIQRI